MRSALVGLSWGIGHTPTLFAAGFAVLVLELTIRDKMALSMEFAVGVLLVGMLHGLAGSGGAYHAGS